MLFVTSYDSPDLDGTACAIAYAELLSKMQRQATPLLFGTPHREAQFVMNKINYHLPKQNPEDPQWILVDCSEVEGLPKKVDQTKVVEIIDHRKAHQANKFPNAKLQIELVGAAATLIAEKFQQRNIEPSKQAAALLYCAIISNTINFQATLTTSRDKSATQWLKDFAHITDDFTREMFVQKSFIDKPLYDICIADFATWDDVNLGIIQLEILEPQQFITKHQHELETILTRIKAENELDYLFISIIGIDTATNTFLTTDSKTKTLIQETLHVQFSNNIAQRPGILMRKQIVPLLLDVLH